MYPLFIKKDAIREPIPLAKEKVDDIKLMLITFSSLFCAKNSTLPKYNIVNDNPSITWSMDKTKRLLKRGNKRKYAADRR